MKFIHISLGVSQLKSNPYWHHTGIQLLGTHFGHWAIVALGEATMMYSGPKSCWTTVRLVLAKLFFRKSPNSGT